MVQERQQQRSRHPRRRRRREKPEFDTRLLDLARVTRVVKGGRRFSFRATVVIGNHKGRVGVGVAKGSDVASAMRKATNDAKKHMITVPIKNGTIPHDVIIKDRSARIILKSAKVGRGVIAGGAIRTVVSLAGISDIVTKSLGTPNKLSVARATCVALLKLKPVQEKKTDTNEKNNLADKKEKKEDLKSDKKVDKKKDNKKSSKK